MTTAPRKQVQLPAGRVQRLQRQLSLAQDQLLTVADAVLTEIGSDLRGDDIKKILISSGSVKVTYLDANHNCVAVWEDPPGVCRECGPGDEIIMSTSPSTPVIVSPDE